MCRCTISLFFVSTQIVAPAAVRHQNLLCASLYGHQIKALMLGGNKTALNQSPVASIKQ